MGRGHGKLAELMTELQMRTLMKSFKGDAANDGGKGKEKGKEKEKGKVEKEATKDSNAPPPPLLLNDLLKIGSEDEDLASGIYEAVLHTLMNQTTTPFTVVMDEFNCYFDHGQYYHMNYDPDVLRPIPPNRISLFAPLLAAVGLEKNDQGVIRSVEPVPMARGGIVVGTSESRAVARSVNVALDDAIEAGVEGDDGVGGGITVVDVPRYSPLEVEHVLANFEIIGIGRLRFDQGATVMDRQEVAYLRMVSGGVGQKLLDSCIF